MNSKKRGFRTPKTSTVLGREARITGDLSFTGGLYVDGQVTGRVTADPAGPSMLTIGDHGSIKGDVRADSVLLSGQVEGDIYAIERAELVPGARVTGTLYYRSLEMAMGAEVNGELVYTESFEQLAAVTDA